MLKIKDGVDLKELEKFGFKRIEQICPIGDLSYYEKQIGGKAFLGVSVYGRKILVDLTAEESSMVYIFSDGLDVLFDLTQAGLVEKVEKRK